MSEETKKLSIKSIILLSVLLPVAVILLSSIAIVLTASSAQEQKVFDSSVLMSFSPVIEKTPGTASEAHNMLLELASDAVESGILRYDVVTEASVSSISATNEAVGKFLSFSSGGISEKIASCYKNVTVKYGEDASAFISVLPGNAPSGFSAEITDGILSVTLSYKDNMVKNPYFLTNDTKAIRKFTSENSGVFDALHESLVHEYLNYSFTVECDTGRLLSYECERAYNYSFVAVFIKTLSDIGSTEVELSPVIKEKYNFSYAGIEIVQDTVTLTANGYQTLEINAFTEAELSEDEYELEFISSDESIAVINENGQVEAVSFSEKPVTVTVKLTYLGREFSDLCQVYVVNETESVKISEKELTLKKGEQHTLSAVVKPDNATVKDVYYYSSDEAVATVSHDGVVTAKGEGTAVISVITVQGLLASECTVTVNG